MRSTTQSGSSVRIRILLALSLLFTVLVGLAPQTASAAVPTWSKTFAPDTIGPGSVSTLTFTITNGDPTPISDLAFTDVLPIAPGAVAIADGANASNTCDGTLTAPAGGGTIGLVDGKLGASSSCTITVDVTAATPGVHTNTTGDLTSSEGNSGTATADLTVVTTLPGFTKSFAPSTVPLGDRSTLTFTIDNTANASAVGNLDFTDALPAGLVIADPNRASTDCVSTGLPDTTVTAVPGASVITLDANGSTVLPGFEVLSAGATCTVEVDVVTTGSGALVNNSGQLLADFVEAGKANATLTVTRSDLHITKEFTDDPTPPGGTSELEFTIANFDRSDPATAVAFTDDLAAALAGLTYDSLLSNGCGGAVAGVGGTTITFTGGTVGAGGSCTIRVSVSVPPGATAGAYVNTTGVVSGTVAGSPVTGNMASDTLFVSPDPILTKEFLEVGTLLPDPVVEPGDSVVIRFTVTNTSTSSAATDVTFEDELTDPPGPGGGFLPFPVSVTLPPVPDPPCGLGSSVALVFVDIDRQALELIGGSLAAGPGTGATCTFDVTVDIPATFPPGEYLNTTEEPSATVDGATRVGSPASDTLTVVAAPQLSKAFTDDPVAPGGTVTLEFTLSHSSNATSDATAITFTDDLAALLPPLAGLTATGLPLTAPCDPDGPGGNAGTGTLSGSVGDTLLTFAGGTLAPGESCTFSVTLDVAAGAAAGTYTNTTSAVGATVGALSASSAPADDDLTVSGLVFSKEFLDDPAIAGETVTLRFTIDNVSPTLDATITFFTDTLSSALAGLAATGPSTSDDCGGTLSGTTSLVYVGGSVLAGASCTIEVPVLVPAGAADGTYTNITSFLSATQGGAVAVDPATDDLLVQSELLGLTKEFTDDPVAPDDTVTLDFTIENLSATETVTDIAFDDDLDATLSGLEAASAISNDCGGMAAGFPAGLFEYSFGTLLPGATCTISLSVDVPPPPLAGNAFPNTTTGVTGKVGALDVFGDAATDTLLVDTVSFAKTFSNPIHPGTTGKLTFTIDNLDTVNAVSGITFSDDLNAVLGGLQVVAPTTPTPCGPGSSHSVGTFLTLSNGSIPAGGACVFEVNVQVPSGAATGDYLNTTSELFSNGVPVADPATDTLTVEPPPTFAKAFDPSTIVEGDVSTLTFTVDNTASTITAGSLDFTDNLPTDVEVATPANASTDCTGGTLTAVAGTGTISYTGGEVAAGATCTIDVDVTSLIADDHVNTTGDLTSSSGNSGTATDTLTVTAIAPDFTKEFAPDTIIEGDVSTLTFTIDNTASANDATGLDFTDDLPADVEIATPSNKTKTCTGGMVDAADGGTTIGYVGGEVAAGATCTIDVDVTSLIADDHVNTTGDLTSSSGNSGTATDTLTVEPARPFTMVTGARYADTRLGGTTFDGLFEGAGPRAAGSTYEVTIAGRGAVPADAIGAIINVTSVGSSPPPGFFTVFDCGTLPTASALNYVAGVDVANEVFAKLSPAGSVCVFTFSPANLLIDVVGYVLPDDTVKLLDAARLAESREGAPTVDGIMAGFGRTTAGSTTEVQITGRAGVPATIHAAIVNVAAIDPAADSFLTVFPCGPVPITSSINYTNGVNRANELIAEVDGDGKICVFTDTDIDLIVDVVGYVEVGSALVSNGPSRFVDTRGGPTTDGLNMGGGPLAPGSTYEVQIAGRDGVPADATTVVANVVAVDPLAVGFLTVTACVSPTPNASSLNYTTGVNGANELVVPLSATGKICVFTSAGTDLLVDVVGYVEPSTT